MKEDIVVTIPNYTYTFRFESDFVYQDAVGWMQDNWMTSFYYVVAYVIFVFGGQYVMQKRKRFELKVLLTLWNIALAAFSIVGALRSIPEFLHILTQHGLYNSVCISSFIEQDSVASFWTFLFMLSKLPELGDTIFIVLRKQPLIFLHWYHHITVLLYSWYSYSNMAASCRWFMVMNYCVHSLMYSYYALRAMGYKLPRPLAMVITSLQLLQMVIGCVISIWIMLILKENKTCQNTEWNTMIAVLMYLSYLVLFAKFFYNAYMSGKEHGKRREDLKNKTQ